MSETTAATTMPIACSAAFGETAVTSTPCAPPTSFDERNGIGLAH
jgi:hypothetical protein